MLQTAGAARAKALRSGPSLLSFKKQEGGASGWCRVFEQRVANRAGSDTGGTFVLTLLTSDTAKSLGRPWVLVSRCLPQHLTRGRRLLWSSPDAAALTWP